MNHDQDDQPDRPLNLQKTRDVDRSQELGGAAVVEGTRETPFQIFSGNGLPAWIGASAAMAVTGVALAPAIAVGAVAGFAFSLLRLSSQR